MIEDGPMKEHMERSKEGVIKSQYITYTVKNGMVVKEISTRDYKNSAKGDYVDSITSEPIVEVK